jgi:hypothetical protein
MNTTKEFVPCVTVSFTLSVDGGASYKRSVRKSIFMKAMTIEGAIFEESKEADVISFSIPFTEFPSLIESCRHWFWLGVKWN